MSPYYELIVQNIRPVLYVLLAAVGLLLLIACANLASLMLARAESRHRELVVRAALGAGRARLLRQLLIEAGILSVVGGAIGLGLATLALRAFAAARPSTVPRIDLLTVDWRVAGFAFLTSALTGVLFALLPAFRAASPDLQSTLRDARSASGAASTRLRRVLVVVQVAVAVVLLVGAGLVIRSLDRLMATDLGFRPTQVVTMRVALPPAAYPTPEAWIEFHQALLDRLQVTPRAESLGLNSALPLGSGAAESAVVQEADLPLSRDRRYPMCLFQATGGDYFTAMGIALVAGRTFDQHDTATGAPVAVVDETFVTQVFKGANPLGRRVAFEFEGHGDPQSMRPLWREVVGVVHHVKHYGLTGEPPYVQLYVPFTQLPVWQRDRRPAMALVARTEHAEALIPVLRQAVSSIDPRLPLYNVETMTDYVKQQTEQPRLGASLLGGFAFVALVLAAVGVYGVLSYMVSQRTREIGVRLALGAGRGAIVRRIVGQALTLAVIGLTVGLVSASMLTRLLRTVLYEVSPTDVATFVGAAVVLGLVAILAGLLPARRAANVDPLVALREE